MLFFPYIVKQCFPEIFKINLRSLRCTCFDSVRAFEVSILPLCLVLWSLFAAPFKRPASYAGAVLALFWAAFCLCIVAFFIAGTVVTVFVASQDSGRWLSALPRSSALPIVCPLDDGFCDLVRRLPCDSQLQSRKCDLLRRLKPSSISLQSIWNGVKAGHLGLITDSLTASYLLGGNANLSAVLLGPPVASLALRTRTTSLQQQLNRGILQLREREGITDGTGEEAAGINALLEGLADALPIRLPMAAGAFYFLLFGACVSVVALLTEFVVRSFITKVSKRRQLPAWGGEMNTEHNRGLLELTQNVLNTHERTTALIED